MAAVAQRSSSEGHALRALQLSSKTPQAYRAENNTPLWHSPAHEQGSAKRVRVTGFNAFAVKAIRAANEKGDSFLELPWSTTDSFVSS